MTTKNKTLTQVHQRAEKEQLRDSIDIYGYLEFLRFINRYTLPGLASICTKSFSFFLEVDKQGKIHHGGFKETDLVIGVFRKLMAMVNELQELHEPEGLIMRLPNSDLEVNVMALNTLLQGLEDREPILSYLGSGQSCMMRVIKKVDVDDARAVYDFIEDFKEFLRGL